MQTWPMQLLDGIFRVCGVSVWCCDLDQLSVEILDTGSFLSDDQREHATRFRFDVHRRRYAASRQFERIVLSMALNTPPRGVRIERTARGKPFVPGSDIHYSLSHAGHIAALAVGRRELGIDIEHLREIPDVDALALQFLPPHAAALIHDLSDRDRSTAFLEHWTLCEAVLKGTGEGLQGDIRALTLQPGQPLTVTRAGKNWQVYTFSPCTGLIGALAVAEERVGPS